MKKVTSVFYLLFIPLWTVFGQDTLVILYYPSEKEIVETVSSMVTRGNGGYRYDYRVNNARTAKQSIWLILVMTEGSVLSFHAPLGWDVDLTSGAQARRRVEWGASDTTYFIKPGDTLLGSSILSNDPPAITNYFAKGWIDLPKVDIEPDSIVGGGDVFETSKSGFTIAPSTPPIPFVPLAFLDTLLSYTRQSAALGWLAPPGQGRDRDEDSDEDEKPEHGLVRNIEQRLNKAKRELQRQDSVKARRELEKLVKKVERVWKRSQDEEKRGRKQRMTSEAYALLKYNTEYLIDRLPKKKGEKDYDDKEDR
jgi:hypothetical protein